MSALDTVASEFEAKPRPNGRSDRIANVIPSLLTRIGSSEYQVVGASRRFRTRQRRRTRAAARIGLLVVAAAVTFDAIALLDLDFESTRVAIALDICMFVAALLGWRSLAGRLRHYPEYVAFGATTGLAISTITTGTLVPSLAVQSVGYLLLIPGVVALLIPWRTRTHVRWLLTYAVLGFVYVSIGGLDRFTADERGDLAVVLAVALLASLAGHVLLQRAQVQNFVQLGRIGSLQRKTGRDMVELERLHHALELTARTDPLTGAGNRRRLEEDLRAVRAHISRSAFSYGIAEIDLDHFKGINDRYGHATGDDVLRRISQAIARSLRARDTIYRLGGEEFLVILDVPNVESLQTASERLRATVADLGIEHPDNTPLGIASVSLGVTFIGPADLDQTDDEWIARADKALYRAKASGRNRVCLETR